MPSDCNICVSFGQEVRRLRLAQGMSQEALAAKAGLDRTYVSGVERGVRNVSLKNIQVLAGALGMSVASLMKGIDA